MKNYTEPKFYLIGLETADVVTISGVSNYSADNENGGSWIDGEKIAM